MKISASYGVVLAGRRAAAPRSPPRRRSAAASTAMPCRAQNAAIALALKRRAGIDQREVDVEEDGARHHRLIGPASVVRSGDDDASRDRDRGRARAAAFTSSSVTAAQQLGQADVVVEAEAEELGGLQERRRCRRWSRARAASSRSGTAATRRAPSAVRPSRRSARDLLVDRRDRAIDVRRADAGANDQRALDDVRVERAEHVVRHPLPLADAVAEPAADRVLAERRCSSASSA